MQPSGITITWDTGRPFVYYYSLSSKFFCYDIPREVHSKTLRPQIISTSSASVVFLPSYSLIYSPTLQSNSGLIGSTSISKSSIEAEAITHEENCLLYYGAKSINSDITQICLIPVSHFKSVSTSTRSRPTAVPWAILYTLPANGWKLQFTQAPRPYRAGCYVDCGPTIVVQLW